MTPDIWTGGLILAASSEVLRMNSRKKEMVILYNIFSKTAKTATWRIILQIETGPQAFFGVYINNIICLLPIYRLN